MSEYKELDFLKYRWLEGNIVEIVVNEGAILDEDHVHEIEGAIRDDVSGPIGVLINQLHQYESSLEAMIQLSELDNVECYAVYLPDPADNPVAETMQLINPEILIFDNRNQAISIMRSEMGLSVQVEYL